MTYGSSTSGSSGRNRATAASSRIGSSSTGPRPGTILIGSPTATSGTTMSLNTIAASTGIRRRGCNVISTASSGRRIDSRMSRSPRSSRYSGRYRPACRMNHTGVRSTGSRRSARRNRSEPMTSQDTEPVRVRSAATRSGDSGELDAVGVGGGSLLGHWTRLAQPDDLARGLDQPVDVERFDQVRHDPEVASALQVEDVVLARADDHRHGVALRVHLLEHLPPVDPRQHHVQQHRVGRLRCDPLERDVPVAGQHRLEPGRDQVDAQDHERVRVVLGDEHAWFVVRDHQPASRRFLRSSSAATCARSASYSLAFAIASAACSANTASARRSYSVNERPIGALTLSTPCSSARCTSGTDIALSTYGSRSTNPGNRSGSACPSINTGSRRIATYPATPSPSRIRWPTAASRPRAQTVTRSVPSTSITDPPVASSSSQALRKIVSSSSS